MYCSLRSRHCGTLQKLAGVTPRGVPDSSHSTEAFPQESPAALLGPTRLPCHHYHYTEAHAAQEAWGVRCLKKREGLLGRAGGEPRGQAHHHCRCSLRLKTCKARAAQADNWLHNLIQAAAAEPAQVMECLWPALPIQRSASPMPIDSHHLAEAA